MTTLKERFEKSPILISDGAWGTQLAEHGLPPGAVPELWNLENPEAVRAVAAAYVEAGSDIILTNTFGGSRFKLEKAGLADRTEEINLAGARISDEAAGTQALVFASVGPTGEFMEPLGTVTEAEMTASFAEQAKALAAGGADGVVVETMTDLTEAKAALRGVKESTGLPVVVSLTYDKGAKGYATMMGVTPQQAAEALEAAGADVIGTNCGNGIENMIEIVTLLRGATSLPIWAKPNAGAPELVDGKTVFRQTPDDMVRHFEALCQAGASIIGGCCGTTPAHLKRFVETNRQRNA